MATSLDRPTRTNAATAGISGAIPPHAAVRHEAVRVSTGDAPPQAPSLRGVLVVWAALALLVVANVITYATNPASAFYNIANEGLAGGLSRLLVVLNFPVAFVAVALAGIAVARLLAVPGAVPDGRRWLVVAAGGLTVVLSLVAVWPGVVQQGDMNAKPINLVPALGVLLAATLTVVAWRRTGVGHASHWRPFDALRIALAAVVVLVGLPWLLADLGVFIGDLPIIGGWFMSAEMLPGEDLPAVHLGHHHGVDGVLFALVALVLTRTLARIPQTGLRRALTGYLAFMVVYGLFNAAQDFWGEQVVKRGTSDWAFPSVLNPELSPEWGVMVAVAVVVGAVLMRSTETAVARRYPVHA